MSLSTVVPKGDGQSRAVGRARSGDRILPVRISRRFAQLSQERKRAPVAVFVFFRARCLENHVMQAGVQRALSVRVPVPRSYSKV